mmetsp:Transcript_24971/g.69646  ORF Transcript_24971/g.69646 Transcript_24971/m.69646 type:complete len:204 (-) Transcript_24971:111-722(-)
MLVVVVVVRGRLRGARKAQGERQGCASVQKLQMTRGMLMMLLLRGGRCGGHRCLVVRRWRCSLPAGWPRMPVVERLLLDGGVRAGGGRVQLELLLLHWNPLTVLPRLLGVHRSGANRGGRAGRYAAAAAARADVYFRRGSGELGGQHEPAGALVPRRRPAGRQSGCRSRRNSAGPRLQRPWPCAEGRGLGSHLRCLEGEAIWM